MAAAPILSWEGLGLIQGSGWLFRDLDLAIAPRDRLALIGRNGAGKSTLLRLISGQVEADKGTRSVQPGTRIVTLEQDPFFTGYATLMDFALHGADAPPRHAVEAIASQLGIDMARPAESASGGERRRAALARALASEPDLLLLDEPTNHLDLAAIEWLESWLQRYTGAFVVISHDRTFLTRLTRATLWIERGSIRRKDIGFGGYDAWTEQVYAEEARAADKLDAKLKIEAHWLERGVTARRKRNQGRLEKLWEMRAQRAAMLAPAGTAKLALASDDVKTKAVIVADKVTKSFGEGAEKRTIIKDFTLRITRGDRIGLVGANGAGKTTLLKLLTGEIAPDTGTVTLAKIAAGRADRPAAQPDEPGQAHPRRPGRRWRLDRCSRDAQTHPGLSQGFHVRPRTGRSARRYAVRAVNAHACCWPANSPAFSNLLVLDEPTNDLDLETLDLLQEVISDYDGTVLIVSHDRDFLDRTVTVTLGLDGSGKVDIVAGGYADWVKQRQTRNVTPSPAKSTAPSEAVPPPPRKAKLSYKDQRDYELLPQQIEALDVVIAGHEAALADPQLYTGNPAKFSALTAAIDTARAQKEVAEMRWLELAELVEG